MFSLARSLELGCTCLVLALPAVAQAPPQAPALGTTVVPPDATSIIVPSGETHLIDTDLTPLLVVQEVVVEAGGTLEAKGSNPVMLFARERVYLNGALRADGEDAPDVSMPFSANFAAPGGAGGPFGAAGGVGSPNLTGSTAVGSPGGHTFGLNGGGPGVSVFKSGVSWQQRIAGSGGGGRFAADAPINGLPTAPENLGLVALAGADGSANAQSALTFAVPALGGAPGIGVFEDTNPDNDFFGARWDPLTQTVVAGELLLPMAGSGGGAGGDSIRENVFPQIPWALQDEMRGAGGGGGGGLVMIATREFEVGPEGSLSVDGGAGGRGEQVDDSPSPGGPVVPPPLGPQASIGGCGGGGSGGMLMVQATRFDFSQAVGEALSARGGAGGITGDAGVAVPAGGAGGPGLIQLHAWNAQSIVLPDGVSIDDLSAPNAKVLLPLALPPLP